jgi:hypothetical protein
VRLLKHRSILIGVGAVALIALAISLGLELQPAKGQATALQSRLADAGVNVESVAIDQAKRTATFTVVSQPGGSPDNAWADTVIMHELIYDNQTANLGVDTYTVQYVDQSGKVLDSETTAVQPGPAPSPTAQASEQQIEDLKSFVGQQATAGKVTLDQFGVTTVGDLGTVVSAEITVDTGSARDSEIRWVIGTLLGALRGRAEDQLAMPVRLYRIRIVEAGTGRTLVEHVVQTGSEMATSWMASDVKLTWAASVPPSATNTTTGQ